MYNENETHRNYELEEFVFDEIIKEEVKHLISMYRSDFRPNFNKNVFVRDLELEVQGIPLFEELKYFYNNDVCIACATCISIMNGRRYNLRTYAYYFENAVHRLEEAWEYIHILLSQVLGLQLVVGKDIRETNIKYRSGEWVFRKNAHGYTPIFKAYKGPKLEEAVSLAEQENVLLNVSANRKKSIFHRTLKRNLASNIRIERIQELYFSNEANELHKIRNELVHRRPLGARFTVAPCIIGPGQAISINQQGWFEFLDKEVLVEKNLAIIREVLQTVQDILFNHDIPNKKENEDKSYYCVSGSCPWCEKSILLPEEMYMFFKGNHLKIPCPCCGKKGVVEEDRLQVNDKFYLENFWQYNEAITKLTDSIFEEE